MAPPSGTPLTKLPHKQLLHANCFSSIIKSCKTIPASVEIIKKQYAFLQDDDDKYPNKKRARIKIQPVLNPISYEKPISYVQMMCQSIFEFTAGFQLFNIPAKGKFSFYFGNTKGRRWATLSGINFYILIN